MGKLEPGNDPIPARGNPSCCARCESRSIKKHCDGGPGHCSWMRCSKCGAVSGLVSHWAKGANGEVTMFIGFKRHWFGGKERVILKEADGV